MSNKEIKYGSEQHSRLLRAVKSRYNFSHRHMSERYDEWRRAEEKHLAYVDLKDDDKIRQNKQRNGEPSYVTLHIPYTYAMALTAHTYWSSVFLSRDPVFQYTGRHGESQHQIQAVEALMDYQRSAGRLMAPLFVWLMDVVKYGVAIIGNYWDEETIVTSRIAEVPEMFYGIPLPGRTKKVKQTMRNRGYMGNRLYNVRPFDFFPDPRVPLSDIQRGEFCGFYSRVGFNTLIKGQEDEKYINVDVLRKRGSETSEEPATRERGSEQNPLPTGTDEIAGEEFKEKGFVNLIEMYIELVPNDWDLGTGKYPETWKFTMANERVLIGAEPLGLLHNKFPFFTLENEIDGYSFLSRGMYEITEPLNNTLDWLFNTHMYNVRKVLNDNLIVDPSRIVMKDLLRGGPGRMIRAKPAAYGQDMRTAIHQLQVQDVTQQHMNDTQVVTQLLQRTTGVTDNVMGMVGTTKRQTATEVRTSSSFAVNRLKTQAEYFSATGWGDMANAMLQNTQQLMDGPMKVRIAGNNITGEQVLDVDPSTIAGMYDFIPVDGTLPIDRFAQANLWKEMLMGIMNMPQIASQYDLGGIFSWVAKLSNLKNIDQFRIQMSPDEVLRRQLEAGNMKTVGGPNGAGSGSASGATPGEEGPVEGAGQVSGMGPVA